MNHDLVTHPYDRSRSAPLPSWSNLHHHDRSIHLLSPCAIHHEDIRESIMTVKVQIGIEYRVRIDHNLMFTIMMHPHLHQHHGRFIHHYQDTSSSYANCALTTCINHDSKHMDGTDWINHSSKNGIDHDGIRLLNMMV